MNSHFTMSAIASQLETRIRANRLALPAAWSDEIVLPYYDGLSLLNVPPTILSLLGASSTGVRGLDEAVWGGNSPNGNVQRVVLFLTDGLGYLWLRQLLQADPELAEIVGELTEGRGLVPLTSIAPSTTAVALPTLWTGVPSAVHGMVGTWLFLRQFSMMGDMLKFKPVAGVHRNEIFGEWGMEPEKFLPVPTLPERLAEAGIPTHLLLPKELLNTGLSRIMHRGVAHHHVHGGYSDFWLRLQEVLAMTQGQRAYVNIYWPAIDTLSHAYGAHTSYLHTEVKFQLSRLRDVLNDPAIRDGQTLFILMADHGHHDAKQMVLLGQDALIDPVYDAMRGLPGGESRFAYLYLRAGKKQQVIDTIETHFADTLTWMDSEDALARGLFGPGIAYHETIHRLGDLIVLPRLNWQLRKAERKSEAISRHGGLSDWEMLIPFLWKRI